VLVYVLDGAGDECALDVLAHLRNELELYCPGLSSRPSLIFVNKADVDGARAQVEQVMGQEGAVAKVLSGSAMMGMNLTNLAVEVRRLVEKVWREEAALGKSIPIKGGFDEPRAGDERRRGTARVSAVGRG
jgi:GTPase involved in cell partitioning and DNA repair